MALGLPPGRWEQRPHRTRDKTVIAAPFAPIDLSGYSSTSVHTVAAIDGDDRFRVIRFNLHKRESILHIHEGDLRSYVLLLVDEQDDATDTEDG